MRLVLLLLASVVFAHAQATEPLQLQQTIPLADVKGRIDHLSIDVKNQRLFVAALGNDTVEVVDLKAGKRAHTISGLAEPQGVLYLASVDRLYVANARDGTLRIYDGSSFASLKVIQLGDDADNVRYDPGEDLVYVGYGSGTLGAFHTDGTKVRDIKLDSHPESFQLERSGARVFVNLPKSRTIAVVDRKTGTLVSTWQTDGALSNYPMALDEADKRLFVVFREPAQLDVLNTGTGKIIAKLPSVGDSDDVFFDAKRRRVYAIGGQGKLSVYEQGNSDNYKELANIATVPGARTGFFSPDLDRLFVAVRQQGSESAAIRVYRPE